MAGSNATVFFDVDTQIDFLLPAGALYVPGAENLIPALAKLTEHARSRGIPIIASADAHAPQDEEFAQWPPHCVAGTLGQRKAPETLAPGAVIIPNSPGPLPAGWESAPQVIVEKQKLDVFTTHTIGRVLERHPGARFVLYGVVTEICVRCAAGGLLKRGAQIDIVSDAIRELDAARSRETLRQLRAAGARLLTVEQALAG